MPSPVSSGRPNSRFMFRTACPAAPFTMLSMVETMMARLVRLSRWREMSQ